MSSTEQSDFFDVERFIDAIQARPSLWDLRCASYSNRVKKQECWREVCRELTADFDSLPNDKQTELGMDLQKKWKGIRSSFARELQKRKQPKSGSAAASRKTYVYFDQLSFLLPICTQRETSSNMDQVQDADHNQSQDQHQDQNEDQHQDQNEDQHQDPETQATQTPTPSNSKKRLKRPRTSPHDSTDRLCAILSRSLKRRAVPEPIPVDDDKSFLLSLHSDLKDLPPNMKLDAKMELISVIRKYTQLQSSNFQLFPKFANQPQSSTSNFQQFPTFSNRPQPSTSFSQSMQPFNQPPTTQTFIPNSQQRLQQFNDTPTHQHDLHSASVTSPGSISLPHTPGSNCSSLLDIEPDIDYYADPEAHEANSDSSSRTHLHTPNTVPISLAKKRKIREARYDNQPSQQNLEEESLNAIDQVAPTGTKLRDDYDIFGAFVASEMRQLRSEGNRRKLKRKIMKAILEVGEEDD